MPLITTSSDPSATNRINKNNNCVQRFLQKICLEAIYKKWNINSHYFHYNKKKEKKTLITISDKQSLFNYSGKNHNISTYSFLFIIQRFECYYTHCQETALN